MSNNKPIDGMIYPTLKASVAGTPRDSAIHSMNSNAQLQAQANNALSGGRHRKRKAYRGGEANSTITAPQVTLLYPEVSGPGTGINSQMQANAQTSTQGFANAALDKGATTMGGTRRRRRSRKGGNPDWLWGCMSGGKKRSRKNTKRRKSRKYRKH
jgi:hypothetical protein